MRVALLALTVLVALAGCSGFVDTTPTANDASPTETASPTATESPVDTVTDAGTTTETAPTENSPTATASPAATQTPGPTPTTTDRPAATPAPSADDPWDQAVVPVVVNDTVDDGRNATAIVERTLAYWNAEMHRFTEHSFRFRLIEDSTEARVEVRFVETVDQCEGPSNHAAGCARRIGPGETARDLEVAEVVSDRSNAFVTGTAKHELGHLLGLGHDDDPRFLMAQNSTEPVRDASERANPWYADVVNVAVDFDSIDADRETVDDQVGHAVAYYDDGAGGTVPTNVSVGRTDHRHAAEVLVTNDPDRCDVDGSSAVELEGQNSDRDDAVEAYTRATVCVDVDGDAVGWHVGYWLGAAFGLDRDELAEPFQDADYGERRSDWWE